MAAGMPPRAPQGLHVQQQQQQQGVLGGVGGAPRLTMTAAESGPGGSGAAQVGMAAGMPPRAPQALHVQQQQQGVLGGVGAAPRLALTAGGSGPGGSGAALVGMAAGMPPRAPQGLHVQQQQQQQQQQQGVLGGVGGAARLTMTAAQAGSASGAVCSRETSAAQAGMAAGMPPRTSSVHAARLFHLTGITGRASRYLQGSVHCELGLLHRRDRIVDDHAVQISQSSGATATAGRSGAVPLGPSGLLPLGHGRSRLDQQSAQA
jgi:hypothetical protein